MSRGSDAARALRVGVVVGVAVVALVGGIWTLGESSRVWEPRQNYIIMFRNVEGLTRGSAVSVAGYTIGNVKSIRLPEELRAGLVIVEIQIESDNSQFIREDTRARLRTMGLLGDRYIDLTPGTPAALRLPVGAVIPSEHPASLEHLLEQGESVTENMLVLTTSMRHIVEKIDRGEGLLGAMLMETPEGKKITEDLKAALTGLRSVAEKADTGTGLAATLLNDPKPGEQLRSSLDSLSTLLAKLDRDDGLVARMFTDKALADEVVANFRNASRHLEELTDRLDSDRGLLGRLMSDEEYADSILDDLRRTSASVAAIARRIEEGEGSLGMLLADETLYEGMNDILAGARKSRLTRWLVQRSHKSGAEQRLESAAPGPSEQE